MVDLIAGQDDLDGEDVFARSAGALMLGEPWASASGAAGPDPHPVLNLGAVDERLGLLTILAVLPRYHTHASFIHQTSGVEQPWVE